MKKYSVIVDSKVKGQEDIDNLNDALDEIKEEQKGIEEGFDDMSEAADKMTGGAVSGMMALKKSVMASVRSLGVMKVAVAATGLGALLLIITSIKAAFTSSEEGQNKFNKLMNALGVITDNLIDILAEFGNVIISAIEDPQQAIKDLWNTLKTYVLDRFNSAIDMFMLLGKAIKQVFEGDFDGAMESAGQAALKLIDSMLIVGDVVRLVKKARTGLIAEMQREIEISNKLSDIQANIAKKERAMIVERARLESRISDIKLEAINIEKNSATDRMIYLEQAMALNDKLFAQEEALAKQRLYVRQEQNKLSGSTADDLMEEAQLEADLITLQKSRSDASMELFSQLLAVRREYNAELALIGQEEIDLDQQIADSIAEVEEDTAEDSVELEGWKIEEKEKMQKISAQGTLSAMSGLFGMLADLSDADFERQKKFRIAEALMNTINGGISAFMGGVATIPGPFGIALGAILAGVTVASGLANIAKIRASKPDGGGGTGGGFATGGGGGGSIPRLTAPTQASITPVTNGEQQISNSMSNNNQPIKAYTVSSDMSSQQELDRRIETKAAI